ncbi:hypothetical protein GALMADRAFT_140055 [Galerina marginata CBS 339.88]|uniref:Rit1 N-terminal domain-containing protein n=1 Tax=Galerina marginata (strain CBS 339.88) TaxID=685588 RepID=A0A067T946_GALM3|nr:hypothetical protein GALMADRAFT_140055 [Galerina marginata CBS 339.88]
MDNSQNENALSYLRKETLDIYNRLHSIQEDVAFVNQVHKAYPNTPLLPNLRCGSWYTDPEIATDTPAYFKSTDGHFNNWSFNLRRSNLHLLPLIAEHRKRIPDALSKTVPIWCAVINRAILIRHPSIIEKEGQITWNTALYTPPSAVSMQEHSQIEQRLHGWAESLAASSFSLPILSSPLRPLWITPTNTTFPTIPISQSGRQVFFPIVCVSASKQIEQGVERRSSGFSYIQGSGDDHELWGMGLTPEMFWTHRDQLLKTERTQLLGLVSRIVSLRNQTIIRSTNPPTPVTKVGGRLLLCTTADLPDETKEGEQAYILLTPQTDEEALPSTVSKLYLSVVSGKKGQHDFLLSTLPKSVVFIRRNLTQGRDVCVACESGKDLSVGIVLAALQLFFTDDGKLGPLSQSDDSQDSTSTECKL